MSGFSFPPPPPPPPRTNPSSEGQQGYQPQGALPNGRGRGSRGPRGGHGQRGRGISGGRGNSYSSNSQGLGNWNSGGQQNQPVGGNYQQQPHGTDFPSDTYVNPNFHASQNGRGHVRGNSHQSNGQLRQQSNGHYGAQQVPQSGSPPRTTAGHKRKLEALRPPQEERTKKPGPQTAPAVPSFGAPIMSPQQVSTPAKNQSNDATKKPAKRSLGLVPSGEDAQNTYSDSEDEKDVDEEAMFAELGSKLTFEHNGEMMSLNSQADLAAWKKERQKKWPTKARMVEKEEEKRQIGEERKRLLASANALQPSMQRHVLKTTEKPRSASGAKSKEDAAGKTDGLEPSGPSAMAPEGGSKLENAKKELALQEEKLAELRRRVTESETKNREAKAQNDLEMETASTIDAEPLDGAHEDTVSITAGRNEPTLEISEQQAEDGSAIEPSSELSPDSSSDSDDSAPEEIASKPAAPTQVDPRRPLCRYFSASGYCRDGEACRFRHEQQPRRLESRTQPQQKAAQTMKPPQIEAGSERKTILQRLVEQEQVEGDRLALQVVKYLGRAGFFRESGVVAGG